MSHPAISAVAAKELSGDGVDVMAGILVAEGLPADDIHEPGRRFFAFFDAAGTAVGYGGIEAAGPHAALLRSIVVKPLSRRAGHGRAITDWLAAEAKRGGAQDIYLLTTTAQAFFRRLGFEVVHRAGVPAAIAATRQFSTLCPASAVVMRRR